MLRYTPLSSPSAIRLLSWNGTSYILQDADLDDGPEYEALSYCWSLGDGNDEGGHIICDGQQLKVMANLRDGLERLRAAGRFGPVWIDAVCINQDDLPERGAQVEMMDRIFGSAKAVIVWLGK
ncbi:heterokaryon incompatibility protein-domain-containing protein, partial [Lineolata rhizophorae]